jgi:hypothetical protein
MERVGVRRIKIRKNTFLIPLILALVAQVPYLQPHFRHPWQSSLKGEGTKIP